MSDRDSVKKRVSQMLELLGPQGAPNINDLWRLAKDIEGIKLNIKFFGYELARELAAALPSGPQQNPGYIGLKSKASTQKDIESAWVAYWMQQLKAPVLFHRKIWELAYALQALNEHGMLVSGRRGLGFACGQEPLPSLMASLGVDVTITDLDPDLARARGWLDTNQHATSLERCHRRHLVGRDEFLARSRIEYVDMTSIPQHLRDFDFCWSLCSLEHLGSIAKGLDFIENSLHTLRPGGVAVHTTEFNFGNDTETIDNWITVLFQRSHFEAIAARLRANGHWVAALDFDIGSDPLDRFIDMPPYAHDLKGTIKEFWSRDSYHIKLMIDGFPTTCFGLIIRKGGSTLDG